MRGTKCVILVGHGAIPSDCPKDLVAAFKRLEAAAPRRNSKALAEADAKLRNWPRTPRTDPYKAGLEAVAEALQHRLPGRRVLEAYNEFCAPSLEQAVESAVAAGSDQITVVSTMFTRGGVHSESDIPRALTRLKRRHPKVVIYNTWPFDLDAVSRFMAGEVERVEAAIVRG